MENEFISIGRVLAPWGKKGDFKVEVLTDFFDRFEPAQQVYIEGQPFPIERSRLYKGKIILKLAAIDNIDDAESMRNKCLEIPLQLAHVLDDGQYFHFQIIGLEVRTTEGMTLGTVIAIHSTGSNDVYVVRGKNGEYLIPAIEDVIKSVDPDKGCIIIELIDGLLDL